MLTNNVYTLFSDVSTDQHILNANEFILLPHQVIPKYYIISEPDVGKLILHYSLGSGKTATAVFALLHYLKLFRMYNFMNHYAKLDENFIKKHNIRRNVIVVGAWQTQSQIEIELMRPEFGLISEKDANEVKNLLSSTLPELRARGEELRKHQTKSISKDIRFCGYQSFFNLIFPFVKSEFYCQNVDTLIAEYTSGRISVSPEFIENYRNSIIIIDEMQRLYSVDGLNTFGVAVLALSKISRKYNIKLIFLTGTMINSSVREIVDIMNIISDDTNLLQYEDYITAPITNNGISVVKIKPECRGEIVSFFQRYFMYYSQMNDKVTDIPRLLTYSEMLEMMKESSDLLNGVNHKKKKIKGGSMLNHLRSIYDPEELNDPNVDIVTPNEPIDPEVSFDPTNIQIVNDSIHDIVTESLKDSSNELVDETLDATIYDDTPDDVAKVSVDSPLLKFPFTFLNQIFVPEFIRSDKRMKYLIHPKVDLIPQEIHIGNIMINDVNSMQPMIIYSVTVEGYQANAYAQYVSNFYNQRSFSAINQLDDENQQSENTVYIQDAYIPPTEDWLKYGIIRESNGSLYGRFLAKENLRQFSAIGYEMLQLCLENTFNNEKTIVYHNKLNAFGINQYALILKYNGFVPYGQSPVDKSICRECKQYLSEHHKSLDYRVSHRVCNHFQAMNYAVLSGALQQFERDNLTNNVFNNPNNLYGSLISIMFVSDVAYSGVSFFNTNNIMILSRIPNISKWKQIYSRIIRTRSHKGLPSEKQHAKVYTFVIDHPNELTKYKPANGFTVGALYYKQREIANEDIKTITQDIADNCISSILLAKPDQYIVNEAANNICNDLLRSDIRTNIDIILRRIMNDPMCSNWLIGNFIRRLKDPNISVSFINLRPLDTEFLMTVISELRRTNLFTYDAKSNTKYINYAITYVPKKEHYATFGVHELNMLKLSSVNVKTLLKKLESDTAMSTIVNRLARVLKLCRKNYLSIVNSTVFWDKMYELGNEFYSDDETNFFHNHTRKNRNKGSFTGCYYGNEIILKNGSSSIINYKFPLTKPKPGIGFTFKISCLVISENSPFYIHVNVVKLNEGELKDRRKINKGVICTSANLDDVYKIFPKLDKNLAKKNYCKELLYELCELQEKESNYKFVFSPFEK